MKLFYLRTMLPFYTSLGGHCDDPYSLDYARYQYFDTAEQRDAYLAAHPEDVFEIGEAVIDDTTGELRPVESEEIDCDKRSDFVLATKDFVEQANELHREKYDEQQIELVD